jgi:autophagy-related protein 9
MRGDYYSTKHGKMAASYYGFIDNYVLNPKTGVPGHIPPGVRQQQQQGQFQLPPSFPGLMSPTLAADMQTSRMGRSGGRPLNRGSSAIPQTSRTPRFQPANHASPMPSILLDPHHQPSSSGFGGRSVRRNSRSRYQARENIMEEPIEDEDEADAQGSGPQSREVFESTVGLEGSRWETSPTRGISKEASEEEGDAGNTGGGVLGLLYQFQKAQTDGRPGVSI